MAQAVDETQATDAMLKKYGISGGPSTNKDIVGAGPLPDLPGGIGGVVRGSGPRST